MIRFTCPYLSAEVELSDERERHIAENHPDLLPEHRGRIADTLAHPDQIRRSARFSHARLFTRRVSKNGRTVIPSGARNLVFLTQGPSLTPGATV
jgi:hypothetical protein